ncbi:MAG: helix-turn-helix domain-containing protein [Fimbriimonadia bacterium]|nr:helix-turn-helix domain-containing protein [Fimbriimonadia bacterium]
MNQLKQLVITPNVYYTVEEAAIKLRVSPNTIVRMLKANKIRGVKVGRKWLILGSTLLNLSVREADTEESLVSEWLSASSSALQTVWDNDEDAVYDHL